VPRPHSCERLSSLQEGVRKSADTARRSACATIAAGRSCYFQTNRQSTRSVLRASGHERKLHAKPRTGAPAALYFDGSAVLPHNSVGHRKSQTGSLAGCLGGEERIVDARQVFRLDSLPAVGHVDTRKTFLAPGVDGQRAALLHGVAGVQEKIQKNLLQFAGVAFYGRQGRLHVQFYFDRGFAQLMFHQA